MKHVAESERFNHFCLNWVKSYIVAFEFVFLSILKQLIFHKALIYR